jgi:hypothetical protein
LFGIEGRTHGHKVGDRGYQQPAIEKSAATSSPWWWAGVGSDLVSADRLPIILPSTRSITVPRFNSHLLGRIHARNYQVHDEVTRADVRGLNIGVAYYVAIDVVNEIGIAMGTSEISAP